MDGLASPTMSEHGGYEALQRYFAGFGIAEARERDRLTAAVMAEAGDTRDAEALLIRAQALVGAWFAQAIGLSPDFAAAAPSMAMAAFQRGRFAPGTLLAAAPVDAETLAALKAAVPVVRPASSGLPMLPQTLALPSLARMARAFMPMPRPAPVEPEPLSAAH